MKAIAGVDLVEGVNTQVAKIPGVEKVNVTFESDRRGIRTALGIGLYA